MRLAAPAPRRSWSWSATRQTRSGSTSTTSQTSCSQPRPEQLGTGHAVKTCRPLLAGYQGPALILVGDVPFLRPQPLADLLDRQHLDQAACLLGTALLEDPTGFGRILRDSAGRFLRIVEERDCTPEERALKEVNPSCYVFELPVLWDALDQVGTSNAQGEYYLTDAPEHVKSMGRKVVALNVLRADDVLGINTRQHLAQAEAIMQARIQDHWMTEGVTIVDPRNTYIDGRCSIGRDSVIYPFTVISGAVKVGSDCRVGPFAHLRDGTVLQDGVEVGAFVEIKQSHLGSKTIARHLAYLGNAAVGENVISALRRLPPTSTARGRARPGSATGAVSAPERSWSRRSVSVRMPSWGPTPSSPATRMSPPGRPSPACRPGRSRAHREPEIEPRAPRSVRVSQRTSVPLLLF